MMVVLHIEGVCLETFQLSSVLWRVLQLQEIIELVLQLLCTLLLESLYFISQFSFLNVNRFLEFGFFLLETTVTELVQLVLVVVLVVSHIRDG